MPLFTRLIPSRIAWPALIWLATALPVGAGAWLLASYEEAAEDLRFDQTVAQATQSITLRLRECETKMLALASWLDNQGLMVDNSAWELAEQRLQVGRSGACNGSVGAYRLLQPSEVARHEAELALRMGQPYSVRPPGARPWYAPNTLVAPLNEKTRRALGLDPANAPKRREALERARDTGRPAATVRVDLRMLDDNGMAIMLFAPVYRRGLPQDSLADRRAAIVGWVGQPLRIDDVIRDTATEFQGLQLQLIEPQDAVTASAQDAPGGPHAHRQTLRFGERDWVLLATAQAPAAGDGAWRASGVLAVAGLVLASLAAAAGGVLLRQRGRAYRLARRFSRKLRSHAGGLRAVLEGARDGIVQLDMQGRVLAVNRAAEGMLGRHDLVGRDAAELYEARQRDVAATRFADAVRRSRQGQVVPVAEIRLQHADGHWLPVRSSMSRAVVQGVEQMIWLIGDISREHDLRAQAAQAQHLNALLLDAVPSALMLVDALGRITRSNPAARTLLGHSERELLGMSLGRLHEPPLPPGRAAEPAQWRSRRDDAGRLVEVEWCMRRSDGSTVPVVMLAVAVDAGRAREDDEQSDSTLLLFTDISERKRATAQIEHLALHDSLTGLPNRLQLEQQAQRALEQAGREGRQLALVLMDLDRFKQVNDTLGHPVGDRLLQGVAQRLTQSVRSGDLVARMGGDEFVLLLRDIDTPEDAMSTVEQVRQAFRASELEVEGHRLRVTPSIGVALFPGHGDDLAGLLRHADLAMYRAKAAGRDTALLFDPERHAIDAERLRLEADLRTALQANQLLLHYQPVVDTATGRIKTLEALMRWQHPVLGRVAPNDFINIAEDTGEIVAIGAWALAEACSTLVRLRRRWPQLRVAVNVSARQLLGQGLVAEVAAVLARTGLPGEALEIEITESALVETQDHVLDKLAGLRSLGVGIAIDDFGTGYSSLAYLASFPVTTLKVDRSFVHQIDDGHGQSHLAGAIVSLAHSMGLEAVAEGVETEAQWRSLQACTCASVQGWLFSPAVPEEELPAAFARVAELASSAAFRRERAEEARDSGQPTMPALL